MPTKITRTYSLTWTPKNVRRISPGAGRRVYKRGSEAVTALADNMSAMTPMIAKESEKIVRKFTEEHNESAKQDAPFRPGELRSSFDTEYETREGAFYGRSVARADHAPFMEYGFHHWRKGKFVRPRPFMFPAFARVRRSFTKAIRSLFG